MLKYIYICFKWPILNVQALRNAEAMQKTQNKACGPNYKVLKLAIVYHCFYALSTFKIFQIEFKKKEKNIYIYVKYCPIVVDCTNPTIFPYIVPSRRRAYVFVDLKGLGTDHVTFCLGTEEELNLMQRKPYDTNS